MYTTYASAHRIRPVRPVTVGSADSSSTSTVSSYRARRRSVTTDASSAWVTSTRAPASASMPAMRSGGYAGSIGT